MSIMAAAHRLSLARASCTPSSQFSVCGHAMWACTQLTGRGVVGMYCGHAMAPIVGQGVLHLVQSG